MMDPDLTAEFSAAGLAAVCHSYTGVVIICAETPSIAHIASQSTIQDLRELLAL